MKKVNILITAVTLFLTQAACARVDFNTLGDANWRINGSEIEANSGKGFLVSKDSYRNFHLKVEFSAGTGTNSGVFFRCADPGNITDKNCFEVNIFDTRPDQTYRTGAVTGHVAPKTSINAEDGRLHTLEIIAVEEKIRIILDDKETVYLRNASLGPGHLAFQLAQGQILFRNLQITHLRANDLDVTSTVLDGVWELKSMDVIDSSGNSTPWCQGVYGVIMYTNNYMSTAVNCTGDPTKSVLYSGPFKIRGQTVFHHAQNAATPSLIRTHRRDFQIREKNNLELRGPLGTSTVIVKWVRR